MPPTRGESTDSSYNFLPGMGQTEFDIMDLEDQKLLEREMLTLLGLTHVPENAVHKVYPM